MTAHRNHACVIGGSIAGLLAGRVLAEHFGRVTIVERDELPNQPMPRKSTPHAQHTNGLLARGLTVFEEFFPGIREELIGLGASYGDVVGDCHWHAMGGFHAAAKSGIVAVSQSRAGSNGWYGGEFSSCPMWPFVTERRSHRQSRVRPVHESADCE